MSKDKQQSTPHENNNLYEQYTNGDWLPVGNHPPAKVPTDIASPIIPNKQALKEKRKKEKNQYAKLIAMLCAIAMLALLCWLIANVNAKLLGKNIELANQVVENAIIENYPDTTLEPYNIERKWFSHVGIFGKRVNYIRVIGADKKPIELRIPSELYTRYNEGDTIHLHNDNGEQTALSEKQKVLYKQ